MFKNLFRLGKETHKPEVKPERIVTIDIKEQYTVKADDMFVIGSPLIKRMLFIDRHESSICVECETSFLTILRTGTVIMNAKPHTYYMSRPSALKGLHKIMVSNGIHYHTASRLLRLELKYQYIMTLPDKYLKYLLFKEELECDQSVISSNIDLIYSRYGGEWMVTPEGSVYTDRTCISDEDKTEIIYEILKYFQKLDKDCNTKMSTQNEIRKKCDVDKINLYNNEGLLLVRVLPIDHPLVTRNSKEDGKLFWTQSIRNDFGKYLEIVIFADGTVMCSEDASSLTDANFNGWIPTK